MKKDELEIEEKAQKYFQDVSRSIDSENELLESIYKNKNFVLRIVSKAANRYENIISDLSQLKHDAVLRTFKSAKENYNSDRGSFVNYFSRNLKFYTEEILKKQDKRNRQLILDAPLSNEDDKAANIVDNLESNIYTVNETEELVYEEEFLYALLNSLNKLFLSIKAGRDNKSKVYSYVVLECLLYKTDEFFKECVNKYDFLNLQKEKLQIIRTDFLKTRNIPKQKEYAQITGMPANKFADIKLGMENYLREAAEMQDYK